MARPFPSPNKISSMLMRGISRFAGPRRSVLIWVVVLFVIAGLLATTAVLQYRWIKQISSSMEIQVRSNLQSQMTQWSLDFYGELSAICVALQVGPDSGARDDWTDYLQRYSEWSRKHLAQGSLENIRSNPALISRIYIWETSERAKPRLLFLDPSSNQIEQIAIPPQLEPLLVRLKESSQNLPMALRAWELPDSQNPAPDVPGQPQSSRKHDDPITGWQFDENIPAIVHPLVHHVEPLVHAKTQIPRANEPVDWIVIVLDLATIQKTVLPQLANRYFGNDQELDYKLAVVVTGKPPHVIYSSDVNFPDTNSGAFDSTMNVFGPPPESTEGHLWESLKNVESLRRQDWRTFSGPGWFPVIQYQTGTDPWMLVVKRRAGPLSAVVNRVWRTNLFTGLAVLFLLTASVGLAILATQRVQRLASLQMNFVANVSHELRTPLTVILSAAENIADGVVEEQSAVKEHGGIITSQGRLLLDLVDRILLFAASTAGKKLQFLRPVQVSPILERALQNVAGIAQLAGIEIEKSIQPDLPNILADPVALCQCVQNLIVNAIKYRGRSNWISISAELQQSKDSARQICIRVQDRGIGIRDSELQRIFEPFYRSPETFATNVQGTGLGLTVTQRSVSDMGGKLMVSSTIGVGSTFTIQLPVAESFPVAPLMPHSDGTLGHSR